MRIFTILLFTCFILTSSLETGYSDNIFIENEIESIQDNEELLENNEPSIEINNRSNAQTKLSFAPPPVGQVGTWVGVGSSSTNTEAREFILNNYLPSYLGEKVLYSGKLGEKVGDTLRLTIEGSTIININYNGFSSSLVPYVSWYGQMSVDNLTAKASSSAVSVEVANNTNGTYEITLTRKKEEKTENYEITLSYDYTFEYYLSTFVIPILGSGKWTEWMEVPPVTISSRTTTISIPAEPISDNLSAEPISQSVNVGTEVNSLDLRDFVENVKIGNTTLSNNQYDVSLLDTSLDLNLVGNKTAKVRVSAVSDSSKAVDVDVPVNVLWGNTIVAKDASLSKVVASVSMLDNNGSPYFVANKGNGLSTATTTLGSRPQIFLYDKDLNNYKKKISSTANQTSASFMNVLNTEFEAIKDFLSYGDVISFTVFEYAVAQNNYNGKNTWTSRNEELVRETEGFDDAFYELTQNGFRLLHLNQLSTTKNDLTLYTKNSYLETHIDEYIDIGDYENITVKFKKYPDTSSTGEQTGVISAEETLSTGEKVQYDYNVIFNVIDDRELSATPNGQKIYLGEDVGLKDYSNFVKDVKLGEQELNETEYTVDLVNDLHTDTVGEQTAKIKISHNSDERSVEIDVPVIVDWGNALQIKGYAYQTISGLALVRNNSNYQVVSTRGTTVGNKQKFLNSTKPDDYFGLSIYRHPSLISTNDANFSFMFKGKNEITSIQEEVGSIDVELGDLIHIFHEESVGYKEMISLYNDSIESKPYVTNNLISKDSLYEVTDEGFNLIYINQLTPKTIDVPIYSSKEYLDKHVTELIDLKSFSNISVKEFSEYPKTTASGKQTGKVIVEETLNSGKTVQYEYDVTINVGVGNLTLSVPKTLTFNNFKKSKSDQIIQRRYSGNLGLVVNDNRGENAQGNWTLTAQVSSPNDGIAPYLVYRNEQENDSYLNGSAVPVYTQTKQSSVSEPLQVEVSGLWTSNTGILLNVPSKNTLSNQSYSTTITWNLVEGP